MIEAMPRPRPPYLSHQRTRHGKLVWYVRRPLMPRIRIRAPYGTPEFMAEYQAAMGGSEPPRPVKADSGTLAWLIESYRSSAPWKKLSAATRRQRENIFARVIAKSGKAPAAAVEKSDIIAALDDRADTPAAARNFLDAMKGLFRWAASRNLVPTDPTLGVSPPIKRDGDGFLAWSEEDVERYEARWPVGTPQRVWLAVLLYTGLRRGDAVRIGWRHVWNGVATIRTEKTNTEVSLPVLPALAEILEAGPTAADTWICGSKGGSLKKESFGNQFKDACLAAGLENKSAHGVRKIGAARAALAGASVNELNAIFGWTGVQMAKKYTDSADRRRLATAAMHKIEGPKTGTSIVTPMRPGVTLRGEN